MQTKDQIRETRETSIGWMIQRIAGALDRRMNARLAELDLTLPSFAVLMTVLEHGPMMQTDIARRYGMPAYTISRALDALERQHYVARAAHASSRRAHSIEATEAGLALAPRLRRIVREVNAELTAPLSDTERAQFNAGLTKLLPEIDAP